MALFPHQDDNAGLQVVPPQQQPQEPQETQPLQHDKPAYYVDETPYDHDNVVSKDKMSRTICGVRMTTIWWLIALLVALGAGIGGGVGGTLAVKNSKSACEEHQNQAGSNPAESSSSATQTSTASQTSAAPFSISTTPALLELNCPLVDKSIVRITLDDTSNFLVTCAQEIGKPDILAIVSYSKEDCAKACASYNRNLGRVGCKGAVFDSQFATTVKRNFGTCFLKSNASVTTPNGNNNVVGMVLQQ